MRILLLTSVAETFVAYHEGQVVDFDPEKAALWIRLGWAKVPDLERAVVAKAPTEKRPGRRKKGAA